MGEGNVMALNIAGWGGYIVGTVLWLHGYYASGSTTLVDWPRISPTWVSSLMPNMEAELGMLPMLWITYKQHTAQ